MIQRMPGYAGWCKEFVDLFDLLGIESAHHTLNKSSSIKARRSVKFLAIFLFLFTICAFDGVAYAGVVVPFPLDRVKKGTYGHGGTELVRQAPSACEEGLSPDANPPLDFDSIASLELYEFDQAHTQKLDVIPGRRWIIIESNDHKIVAMVSPTFSESYRGTIATSLFELNSILDSLETIQNMYPKADGSRDYHPLGVVLKSKLWLNPHVSNSAAEKFLNFKKTNAQTSAHTLAMLINFELNKNGMPPMRVFDYDGYEIGF